VNAKGLCYGGAEHSQQHPGQAADIDDQLQLIGLMHAHARMVDAGKAPQEIGPEAGLHFVPGFNAFHAHAHDLRAEGQYVALFIQGPHILFNQLLLAFAPLNEMCLDGVAVIFAAVLAGDGATVKVYDAVFLTALIFQIPGWDDAHNHYLQTKERIQGLFYTRRGIIVNLCA